MTDNVAIADAHIDWKYMAWTQSLAAGCAWDAGYAAAKEQYGGFSIDIDQMAVALQDATGGVLDWEQYIILTRAALDYIEKQADA